MGMQAVRANQREGGQLGVVGACLRVALVMCVACGGCDEDASAGSDDVAASDAAVDARRPGAPVADAALVVPICGALGEQPCSTADASVIAPGSTCEEGNASACPEDACDAGECGGARTDVSCDTRQVLCKKAPPDCAEGQVPTVVDTCYGACVKIDRCVCHEADECPQREQYVCHMYAAHCGPYVN